MRKNFYNKEMALRETFSRHDEAREEVLNSPIIEKYFMIGWIGLPVALAIKIFYGVMVP